MRWIFYTLVFVNVAVFLWQFDYGRDVEKASRPAISRESEELEGFKQIILLSEARDLALPAEVLLSQGVGDRLPEVEEGNNEVLTKLMDRGSDASSENESADMCGVFGPFVDQRESELFSNSLSSMRLPSEIRSEEMERPVSFWVYVAPFSSSGGALSMINSLKEYGIESFLINEGALANGLSLGVFEQQAGVSEIAERVGELGLDVKVVEKTRGYNVYWVVLRLEKLEIPEPEMLAKTNETNPLIKYRQKVCKSVASTD